MCPQEKMIFVNTTTIKYDDFIGHKEQLRIAPCRRCARIGRTDTKEIAYQVFFLIDLSDVRCRER